LKNFSPLVISEPKGNKPIEPFSKLQFLKMARLTAFKPSGGRIRQSRPAFIKNQGDK